MTDTTLTALLFGAKRLANSVNGNPRFELDTSRGYFKTKPDTAISYEVENFVNGISRDGLLIRFTINGRQTMAPVLAWEGV